MVDYRSFDTEARRLVDWLLAKVPDPGLYPLIIEPARKFADGAHYLGKTDLPNVYLTLEQFLVNVAQKESRAQLREYIRSNYTTLMESEPFRLIFEPRINQEILLCKQFLVYLFEETRLITGDLYQDALAWVMNMPEKAPAPLPLGLEGSIPMSHDDWIEFARKLCGELYNGLTKSFGPAISKNVIEKGFQSARNTYMGLETFSVLIRTLPGEFLDREKVGLTANQNVQD